MEEDELSIRELMDLWEKAQKEAIMGLGPPVCKDCMVYASYKPDVNPLRQGIWYCPICGNTRTGHLFEIPEERHSEIKDNTDFLKFVLGK